jgi:hypothetical protein
MAVTMKQVRAVLDPEEPDYQSAVALGPDALPHLDALVSSGDPMLASKATYLASLIQDQRSVDVVEKAARSDDPIVRVAAAAAAPNLAEAASASLLSALAADPDPGVRKVARSTGGGEAEPGSAEPPLATGGLAAGERIVFGLMPGEEAGSAGSTMPGSTSDRMPGDRGAPASGLMPGERPTGRPGSPGEMPS